MNRTLTRARALVVLAALGPLVLLGCGDDDDSSNTAAEVTDVTNVADGRSESAGDAGHDGTSDGEVIDVVLADYEFQGLPSSVDAGSRLTVDNVAETELHELVAFRLPDEEERSVEELVRLPPEELMPTLGEPATVLLAAPGGPQIDAVGDGTLDEPGRYAVVCFIPIGVEPDVYLEASEEAEEGPPQIEGAGPPHFTTGMVTELLVE